VSGGSRGCDKCIIPIVWFFLPNLVERFEQYLQLECGPQFLKQFNFILSC
jgi:hypothetical protein